MIRPLVCFVFAGLLFTAPAPRAQIDWAPVAPIPAGELTDLLVSGDTLYVATPAVIYRHPLGSSEWFESDSIIDVDFSSVARFNGRLYAGTFQNGVYESTNGGTTWTPRSSGLSGPGSLAITCLEVRGDSLYAGTSGAGVWLLPIGSTTWQPFRDGLGSLVAWDVHSLRAIDGRLFCGAGQSGFLFFVEPGQSQWTNIQFYPTAGNGTYMLAFGGSLDTLYGAGSNGLYVSVDSGLNWSRTPSPFNPADEGAIVTVNSRIFGLLGFLTHGSYVYEFTNGAWTEYDHQPGVLAVDLVAD